MEITRKQKEEIEEIISGVYCEKDFECYRSRFENVGKIRDVETKGLLKCLEERAPECHFSTCLGDGFSCLCPLRMYIATELHK